MDANFALSIAAVLALVLGLYSIHKDGQGGK